MMGDYEDEYDDTEFDSDEEVVLEANLWDFLQCFPALVAALFHNVGSFFDALSRLIESRGQAYDKKKTFARQAGMEIERITGDSDGR